MAKILGLDLGSHSVKGLVVETTFRGAVVRSFAEARVDPQAGLKGALMALKDGRHLAADQVVVALPSFSVATHDITLPFTDPKRIEATIGFEIEGQLPYDLADVVFDYQVLATRDGKSEVLVGVARKEELKALLATLAEAGVDPRVVTASALPYQQLLADALTGDPSPAPPEGSEAVIDLGHERTSVWVGTRDGGTELARTFAGGGKELTRAIAAEFKVSPGDAEAWKENEGDVQLVDGAPAEVERAAAALLRGLSPLLREIRATFRAHGARTRKPIARIYLAGGTARLKGIGPLFERELGAPVRLLEPVPADASAIVPAAKQSVAAQAFALALRAQAARARFNLRRGAFAFKGDLDYLKGKVSRLAAFAATLAFLALASTWAQFRALSQRETALDALLCQTTQKVLGQCQKDYLVALSLFKGKGSPAESLPQVSALDLFAELTSRGQAVGFKLEEAEVQLSRIRLRGETDSFDVVDKVVNALKEYRCFQEIKRGKVQKNARDASKVQFDLDINVQCPEQAARNEG